MATLRQNRYKFLISKGLLSGEAKTIAGQYNMSQIRTLPYLRALIKQRVAQRNRLQQLGYNYNDYIKYLKSFYAKNGWGNINDENDIWKMIKSHRKDTIKSGDYVPPKLKGSHHTGDISKGDIQGQRKRADKKQRSAKIHDRIDLLRRNIRVLKDEDTKAKYRHEIENLQRELGQLR